MTTFSDREDSVEDPVAYQDAEQLFPMPSGIEPPAQPATPYDQLIAFEQEWPRHGGAKESAIRGTFHLTGVRYYQLINRMIDDPAALELDPTLIYRLRDQRTARLAARRPTPTEKRTS